jgi:outer membrane protein OmpA-like peptidoglycan-associated protein
MSFNLVSFILQHLGPAFIGKIAAASGIQGVLIEKATSTVIKGVLSRVSSTVVTPAGAGHVAGLLGSYAPDTIAQLSALIGGEQQASLVTAGGRMLAETVGHDGADSLVYEVAKLGVSDVASRNIVGMLSPAVLSGLANLKETERLDASGLTQLMAGQSANFLTGHSAATVAPTAAPPATPSTPAVVSPAPSTPVAVVTAAAGRATDSVVAAAVAPKIDGPKVETSRVVEAPRLEAVKVEAPRVIDTPHMEARKVETARVVDVPRVDAPRAEAPRVIEGPKVIEAPRGVEAPRVDVQHTDQTARPAVIPLAQEAIAAASTRAGAAAPALSTYARAGLGHVQHKEPWWNWAVPIAVLLIGGFGWYIASNVQKTRALQAETVRLAEAKKVADAAAARAAAEATAKAQAEAATAKARAESEAAAAALAAKAKADAEAARAKAEADGARLKAEAEAGRLKAEAEAERRNAQNLAEVEARAKAQADAAIASNSTRLTLEQEARQKADADGKARSDAEAKIRADAEAKQKADAEAVAKARADAAAKQKADAEAASRAAAEADNKRKAEAEASAARLAAEADARRKAEADTAATQRLALVKTCQTQVSSVATPGALRFNIASANLVPESATVLDKLATAIKACPSTKIRIEGHTDNDGNEESNLALSQQRAKTVFDQLVRSGVEPTRMSHEGFGQTKPAAPNDTIENKRLNRRIDVRVD